MKACGFATCMFAYMFPYVNICPYMCSNERYRGYYMAKRRYEISLQVLKNISQVSTVNKQNIFSTREEKFRISNQPCNVLLI